MFDTPELERAWKPTLYFKSVLDTIDVEEEFVVYDESGLVASLGGSLGLFLGFSFLNSLVALINAAFKGYKKLKVENN